MRYPSLPRNNCGISYWDQQRCPLSLWLKNKILKIHNNEGRRHSVPFQAMWRKSSRGVAISSSRRWEEPISKPIKIPSIEPAANPPMTLVILDWKWIQGEEPRNKIKAEKTAVGAGTNWKLMIKLRFNVLQICHKNKNNTKEADLLANE